MKKKPYKGRCEKQNLPKFEGVCATYDAIASAYAKLLSVRDDIASIRCNVSLNGLEQNYTSDFVCQKTNGEIMVRECVFRKHLTKPMTAKLLEKSRNYWQSHGIADWGIVIDEESDAASN